MIYPISLARMPSSRKEMNGSRLADQYMAIDTIQTAPRAKTMTFDPATKRLSLSTAESGQFEILVVGR